MNIFDDLPEYDIRHCIIGVLIIRDLALAHSHTGHIRIHMDGPTIIIRVAYGNVYRQTHTVNVESLSIKSRYFNYPTYNDTFHANHKHSIMQNFSLLKRKVNYLLDDHPMF